MNDVRREPLFTRVPANPIIVPNDLPYACNAVFNPGAAFVDGETVLLLRVEDLRGISSLYVARSEDGITGWRFDDKPLLSPDGAHREEVWGCEDPRLVWLPEREEWAITYTAYSNRGPLVSLAVTRDFREVRRLGPVMPPDDKDAALLPHRFEGRWVMIHRPSQLRGPANMWISFSPDLRHWGDHQLVLEAREGAWWDAGKIGLGPPPMAVTGGWLVMYHGAHETASGPIYRVGLALLDRDDPTVVLGRSDEWVLGPTASYERVGDVSKVVFPNGWILDEEREELRLYYGAADSVIAVATARIADVLEYVATMPKPLRRRASDLELAPWPL
jgi:beta-1,4-mannooligosaccharide/beta-1,4-mannosyl-N-acetylglucosamine phosphorylase